MSTLLLCTDLDRTLIPNGNQPESPRVREWFGELVASPEISLVYVTGRDWGRVQEGIERWDLPAPDVVIGDVGTSIYVRSSGHWERQIAWDAQLTDSWGGRSHSDLAALLSNIEGLRFQEPDRQTPHKLSYYADATYGGEKLIEAVDRILGGVGVRAQVVWSIDELTGNGLLDVLPSAASKRHAIDFVRESFGLRPADVFFAGDSGNDIEVLVSPYPSVLVANAREEVKAAAIERSETAGTRDRLHVAEGGWMRTNGCYAAGILEGLSRLVPNRLPNSWPSTPDHSEPPT